MCENPERAQRHGRGGGPPLKFLRRPGQPPGLRPDPFPDRAASLLPGLLAATRTGLTPAGNDELMFGSGHSINHLQTLGGLDPVSLTLSRWGSKPRKGVEVPNTRPPYPPEFRQEAVRLVQSSGRAQSQIAREL